MVTRGEKNNLCTMFVLSTKSWKQLQPLPVQRDMHGSIFLMGRIFLFGGLVSGLQSSNATSLDVNGGEWNKEPDIPITMRLPDVACLDSSIFLLDSFDTSKLLQLNIMTKTWSTKAKPPTKKNYWGARMILINGQLLISGSKHSVFAQYNPFTDTWTTGNVPTLQHYFGALVHHNQKLYLIGGEEDDRC